MDAVAAADGDGVLEFEGAPLERGQEQVDIGDQQVGGAGKLHGQARIEHIRRRHALVHEARFGAHDLGQMGEERDHVVLHFALDRVDARHIECGATALFPDGARGLFRDHAQFGQRVGGMGLDLEPDAEFRFRRPDRRHFGPGVALDHGSERFRFEVENISNLSSPAERCDSSARGRGPRSSINTRPRD